MLIIVGSSLIPRPFNIARYLFNLSIKHVDGEMLFVIYVYAPSSHYLFMYTGRRGPVTHYRAILHVQRKEI